MVRLGNCFTIIRNGASIKQIDGASGLPITRIETISKCEINRDKFGYANICDEEKYKDYFLHDDDILMSHINSEKHLGKCAIYHKEKDEKIIHGMNLLMLRANKTVISPQYAVYYFETPFFKQQIVNITKKSVNQASFTVTALKEIEIPLLSYEKQNKIVKILDKLNEIINKRQQQLKKLDELVKSRFIEMFGDVVINSKNWEQTTLKNVAIGKLTYGSGASAINFNGKIRYIRITDISKDGELNDDMKSPSICDNKYLLNDGDILFARSGATVGKTFCFNKKRYGEAIYAGYLIRMIPDKKRVLPIYVFYYTKTDYYISFISKAQKAVAQPNINAQEYGDLKICLPPIELQQRFVDFVKQTDKSKLEIQKSLDKLEILKKSLMQQYFD